MKKIISLLLSLVLIMSLFVFAVSAKDNLTANIYVSISAAKDTLSLAYASVKVTDIDKDGALTMNDALYCAHEQNFKGGAAKGFKSSPSEYGITLNRLWGVDAGFGYGYYLNNEYVETSLEKSVSEGDHVYAFVYSDTQSWSDEYSFFAEKTVTAERGDKITVSLSKYSGGYVFDENTGDWLYVSNVVPAEGATITVDGKSTSVKTDSEGKAEIEGLSFGKHIISTVSPEGSIITPAVCKVTVKNDLVSIIKYIINYIVSAIRSIFA